MKCPCGSTKSLEECCGPYINGDKPAPTAEALMRSRYTAYTQQDIGYLKKTLAPESSSDFDEAGARAWAAKAKWKKLEIVDTKKGGPEDKRGTVEFVATFEEDGKGIEHHEVSQFRKSAKGEWMFVDGESHTHAEGEGHHHHHHARPETFVHVAPKVGRNDPCTCGSGKKYKKCCGA